MRRVVRQGLAGLHTVLLLAVLCIGVVAPAVVDDGPARAVPAEQSLPAPAIHVFLTTADLRQALQRQPNLTFAPVHDPSPSTIWVNDRMTYQQIDGFGGGFTDSTAWLLFTQLRPVTRHRVMAALFSPRDGIGLSFLRLPIGASDFTHDGAFYSYDDLLSHRPDPTLEAFSIQHDVRYIIPLLHEARALNPHVRIVATPWSAPGWMKVNGVLNNLHHAGRLLPSAFAPLAHYLVKFIQAYQQQGIMIDDLTPLNEPGAVGRYPAMELPAADEIRLVRDYLGPALAKARLPTRILAFDAEWSSNGTNLHYPLTVMADRGANRYLAGTAYHCYRGNPAGLLLMHARYPHKDIYETECSSGTCLSCPWIAPVPPIELAIAATRNWSRSVALWNLALDPQGGPPWQNGCLTCTAPVTIDPATGTIRYNRDYFQLGQASRFVQPGAYRIASTSFVAAYQAGRTYGVHGVDDVAFRNPDSSLVLLAYNGAPTRQTVSIRWRRWAVRYTLPPAAAVTFTWSPARP